MAGFYAKGLQDALEAVTGVAAAPTGTLKFAFMATTYTQDKEADQFWADVSGDIAAGTTVQTVTGTVVRVDTANDRVEIDIDNPTETPVTASTDQGVLFMDTGSDATSPLITNVTITPELNPVGGTLTMTVNVEGLSAVNY